MAEMYRNIGLGIMGMHDCFIKLGITYGSKESIKFADDIMALMFRSAVIESSHLASEKGTYPAYNPRLLDSDIIKHHFTINELDSLGITANGLRNCSLLSIAPTGTLGTMLNISTGCEPLFAPYYTRKTESLNGGEDKFYRVYAGVIEEYMNVYPNADKDNLPNYFNYSANINWHDRVDMQSALQDHVDTAISSTINLPAETKVDEIEQLYLYSWGKGLKGVTIFRANCKRLGILTTDDKKEETEDDTENIENDTTKQNTLKRGEIINCSDDLIGKKRKLISGCGSLHCLAFFDPTSGNLQEVYLAKGSTGGCNNFMIGLSRMISLAARAGVDVFTIKDQLDSTGACPSYRSRTTTKHDTSKGSCCPMAVGNAIIDMWKEVQSEIHASPKIGGKIIPTSKLHENHPIENNDSNKNMKCPECGSELRFEGGCNSCPNCGYSKCN